MTRRRSAVPATVLITALGLLGLSSCATFNRNDVAARVGDQHDLGRRAPDAGRPRRPVLRRRPVARPTDQLGTGQRARGLHRCRRAAWSTHRRADRRLATPKPPSASSMAPAAGICTNPASRQSRSSALQQSRSRASTTPRPSMAALGSGYTVRRRGPAVLHRCHPRLERRDRHRPGRQGVPCGRRPSIRRWSTPWPSCPWALPPSSTSPR